MKPFFALLAFLSGSVSLWAQAPAINTAGGWLESAYVEWQPVSGAESYNVYYTGGGITNQKIDTQLIRSYGTYFRADVLGLAAGSYTLKVVPVISGVEGTATTTSALAVISHDRSGFAFANSRVPGAYNVDGTPKSGAVVLYITENTKNTVSLEVTGANANPCVGLLPILFGYAKGKDTRPLIIRLIGQVTDLDTLDDGDIVIENDKNASGYITLEGVGDDATVDGWGIRVKNATNIEIRNLGIMNVNSGEGDNIGLQQENDYIWVHNNDFFYGDAGSAGDQVKGDGALDCKKSTYVSLSYNHFWDSGKSNLLGLSEDDTVGLYITYHHNWYDHSDSRHPRVRFYSAHVYNNYYDGNSKYGVGSARGSSVFVEANYFRNCKYPMLTAMQGSDVWNESVGANDYSEGGTFSGEDGGTIKAYNNYMEGAKRFVAYGSTDFSDSTVDFDAYVVTSRNATVPGSVKSAYGGNIYNNFDTDAATMYTYTPDSPETAKTNVMTYAGRVHGGDFQWTFINATDDTASAVNTELKSALTSYQTTLVSIQGDGNGSGTTISSSSGNSSSSSSGAVIAGDMVHNFTLSGTTSTYFSITGNLSTAKGSVNYGDLTLTQCLKMESATEITFTLDETGTLTLVFNTEFTGSVLINGTSYTATAGIVTATLSAGTYTITKGDSSNLYYMSITLEGTSQLLSSSSNAPLRFAIHSDRLYLSGDYQLKTVAMIRPNGAIVKQVHLEGNSVDLRGLSSGIYWVKVKTDRGMFEKMIYKE